ncbi:MAG: response regulator transcription factor [Leptospiraceae bacterium]|nr:response regulator transcription factor [Leptospiraceae bacterium]
MSKNDVKGLRILVVDDEEDICDLIRFNLEEEGYVVSVSQNGMDALNKVERNLPDAIILDLMIPGISGMDLCKKIKSRYDIPILMVTARAGETDAVLGLEMGADDYIRKPFSPRELTARLKAVLRRRGGPGDDSQGGSMAIGGIQMNTAAHRVTIGAQPVDLTLIEYKLLKLFMENPDIAFSRDRLLDRVWGRDVYVSDRAVDVNIKRLREKLLDEKQRLETVRGVGYRFRGDSDPES